MYKIYVHFVFMCDNAGPCFFFFWAVSYHKSISVACDFHSQIIYNYSSLLRFDTFRNGTYSRHQTMWYGSTFGNIMVLERWVSSEHLAEEDAFFAFFFRPLVEDIRGYIECLRMAFYTLFFFLFSCSAGKTEIFSYRARG